MPLLYSARGQALDGYVVQQVKVKTCLPDLPPRRTRFKGRMAGRRTRAAAARTESLGESLHLQDASEGQTHVFR